MVTYKEDKLQQISRYQAKLDRRIKNRINDLHRAIEGVNLAVDLALEILAGDDTNWEPFHRYISDSSNWFHQQNHFLIGASIAHNLINNIIDSYGSNNAEDNYNFINEHRQHISFIAINETMRYFE